MAKIADILTTERKRPTAADFDVVHMYKTGQFYTAPHSASYNIRHHLFEEIDGDIIKAA